MALAWWELEDAWWGMTHMSNALAGWLAVWLTVRPFTWGRAPPSKPWLVDPQYLPELGAVVTNSDTDAGHDTTTDHRLREVTETILKYL